VAKLIKRERIVKATIIRVDNQAEIQALENMKGAPGHT